MSDIRARLATALCGHDGPETCDYPSAMAWAEHAAAVLLSLPGIAIVDTRSDIEWIADRMADADDGIIYGLLTPDEAEFYQRMARAALLAAANAAEAER